MTHTALSCLHSPGRGPGRLDDGVVDRCQSPLPRSCRAYGCSRGQERAAGLGHRDERNPLRVDVNHHRHGVGHSGGHPTDAFDECPRLDVADADGVRF